MTNWSGVYTNPNSTGVSTGLNGSNTLVDNTANWPVLMNQYVRITAGLGVGQEKKIANNGATFITIWGSWDTIPDDTSYYEIVLILQDGDHIVANTYFRDGMITELKDNNTIVVDGNYKVSLDNAADVRWNKSRDTVVTFEANNRDTQDMYNFWGGLLFEDIAAGIVKVSYIRIRDVTVGFEIQPSIALGDGSDIHHILIDECESTTFGMYTRPLIQDVVIKNVLAINSLGGCYYNSYENIHSLTFEHFWTNGRVGWYGINSARVQILKDSVAFGMVSQPSTIGNVDKKIYIIDNYFQSHLMDQHLIYPGTGEKGSIHSNRNISKLGYDFICNSEEVEMKMYSRHNDYLPYGRQQYHGLANWGNVAETFTSHSDFIAGRKKATASNIDLTELTDSNHTPPMYEGLSSPRTNAKATPNKLFEIDNVRESDLTSSSIKIKFDCKNSDAGTNIDQDSANGQKVLYITSTSEFDNEETVEIGFGTVRQEEGVVDSIQTGVSITLKDNLTYTHTVGEADSVKKRLRNIGLGFVRYGISALDLDMSTHMPDRSSWGFIYCGFKPYIEEDDDGHEWSHTDIDIDITSLISGNKYYYQVFAYTPLGDLIIGPTGDFTTIASVDYTDPLEPNVRDGTTYKFAGSDKTGTLDLPAVADVRDGVKYDNLTKEGISDHALETDVRKDTKYDNLTKTGQLEVFGMTEASIYNYFTDGTREDAFKADLTNLESDITNLEISLNRCLGLAQENFRVFAQTYDGDNNLLTGTIKIYNNKADCDNDVNPLATYNITATYNVSGTLNTYKVVKN